jgi:hypothetical protein
MVKRSMKVHIRVWWVWLGVVGTIAGGCNLSPLPQSTPTFRPSSTPTAILPTPTFAPSLIALEPTATLPTATVPTASHTAHPTPTPIITRTPTTAPSNTPPPTSRPPTNTPPFQPTATQTNTPQPSNTPINTNTATPNITRAAQVSATPLPSPSATARVFPTLRPSSTPTPFFTSTPPPTRDVTPTIITAAPQATAVPFTAVASPVLNTNAAPVGPSATPTIPPTVALRVTLAPTIPRSALPQLQGNPSLGGNTVDFTVGNVGVAPVGVRSPQDALQTLTGGVYRYAQNPANPFSYAAVDNNGDLFFYDDINTGLARRAPCWPLYANPSGGFGAQGLYVRQLVWSPNGAYIAIQTASNVEGQNPNGTFVINWRSLSADCANNEVYYVLPDCPTACDQALDRPPHIAQRIEWSGDSQWLLIEAEPTELGRRGLYIRPPFQSNEGLGALPYDYGSWGVDGRILVSGRAGDGRVILGWADLNGTLQQTILDAGALGLWLRDAVQRPNGEIVALGSYSGPGGAVALFNAQGQPISASVGDAAPQIVVWNRDRSAVGVTVDGRRFVIAVNGSITELESGDRPVVFTDDGNVGGNAPAAPSVGGGFVPSGVIEGSIYTPGQQLRYLGNTQLNIRATPDTAALIVAILEPASFVVILAGPTQAQGIEWWQVQTAEGTVGWIAGSIGGRVLLGE